MGNLKEINQGFESQRDAALENLFANMPSEVEMIVDLPSRGKFYNGFAGVKVTPLLFEDEQRILVSKHGNTNPINLILEKCVHGVKVGDLLLQDKLFLLLKVKEVSYGEQYNFELVCPKCSQSVKSTVNVATGLRVNYFPDNMEDPREITLPRLGAKVKVKFPRVSDEIYFKNTEDSIHNLYRFVVSINGQEDPVFIAKALKRMHIRDLKVISNEINRNDLGLDSKFHFECPHCNYDSIMELPFTANFFSVN